jgi:hypothetical protein
MMSLYHIVMCRQGGLIGKNASLPDGGYENALSQSHRCAGAM